MDSREEECIDHFGKSAMARFNSEWESNFGLVFRTDGRIVRAEPE
jgi:hypothetical protein